MQMTCIICTILRDRARAAAHRAAKQLNVNKPAATAVINPAASVAPVPEASSSPSNEADPIPPPNPAATATPIIFANEPSPVPPSKAAPAVIISNHPLQAALAFSIPPPNQAASAVQSGALATLQELMDEFVPEPSETNVNAMGVFENCPDDRLSEEYFVSLRKFILSEKHLEDNISSVKFVRTGSRQIAHQQFVHTMNVQMSVKAGQLSETPLTYIKKHLESNDWLKGNKTRITLANIHL
jgi:hypothetical protein